jgi:hypothetical protein
MKVVFSHIEHISLKYPMKVIFFTQMDIFSHIEHISHKYPMKVKFSHKWLYFHTLSIFHTNIQWNLNFHTNGHILTHWAYFTQISNHTYGHIFTHWAYFTQLFYRSYWYLNLFILDMIEKSIEPEWILYQNSTADTFFSVWWPC